MKVLTVWQPWASLIAVGAKPYEFRGHRPPPAYVGRRIAINAGKRRIVRSEVEVLLRALRSADAWRTCLAPAPLAISLLELALHDPSTLPLGAIVCTAVLGAPRGGWDIAAEFGGRVNDSDRHDKANFGWPLRDIDLVMPPVEHIGRQGWSEWRLT